MQLRQDKKTIQPIDIIEIEHSHTHDDEVSSVGIESKKPLDMQKFNLWMGMLLQRNGQDIFRSKGILYFKNYEDRVVFQGVHMLFDAIPDRKWTNNEVKRNQLIFIGRNLDRESIINGFNNCLA